MYVEYLNDSKIDRNVIDYMTYFLNKEGKITTPEQSGNLAVLGEESEIETAEIGKDE
jgi:hypothetical protein